MNKKGIRDGISNTVSAVSDLTVGSYSEFKESMAQARTAYEEASNSSGSAVQQHNKYE
ncbi:hypothetical protein C442_20261 [Haloarcula amylolytica JCM 13557]|uniref:Uncharacterized protein n=1 Tax=Haloarcula amylolytica JCM 13557 TaxID=1227452 RepID=M0JYF6_9EURY|nr:hypothetical protein C442_20261 [Haloarcula amylolytica JCM 13557]